MRKELPKGYIPTTEGFNKGRFAIDFYELGIEARARLVLATVDEGRATEFAKEGCATYFVDEGHLKVLNSSMKTDLPLVSMRDIILTGEQIVELYKDDDQIKDRFFLEEILHRFKNENYEYVEVLLRDWMSEMKGKLPLAEDERQVLIKSVFTLEDKPYFKSEQELEDYLMNR